MSVHLFRRIVFAFVLYCLFLSESKAQTWIGTNNTQWGNSANWNGGVPGAGAFAFFDNSGNGNVAINLGGAVQPIGSIIFDSVNAAAYTFSGNTGDAFLFDPSGMIVINSGVITPQTFATPLHLLGAFTANNDGAAQLSLNGAVALATGGTAGLLTVSGSGNTTIGGGITAGAVTGLTKIGTGTLMISGTGSHTGATTLLGGTTIVSAVNGLGTGTLTIGDTSPLTANLTLNANQTFTSMIIQSSSATANTITVGPSATMTVTGSAVTNSMVVGMPTATVEGTQTKLVITGETGTFLMNNSSRNLVVHQPVPTISPSSTSTLDMSGLGTFNAVLSNLYVGRATNATGGALANAENRGIGVMRLAHTNAITSSGTNGIVVGSQSGSSQLTGFLRLGTSNTIGAVRWVIGNARASGEVTFDTGLTNPSATLFGATGPTSRTNITLGDGYNVTAVGSGSSGSSSSTGTLDFTGGTLNAMIGTFVLGNGGTTASDTRGRGNGIFKFGGNSSIVDVNSLTIATNGSDTSNVATTTGTNPVASTSVFEMNGGQLFVNTSFLIARNIDSSGGSGQQSVTGTFTLNGGTATIGSTTTAVNTIIGSRTSTSTGTNTATININGGTLISHGNIAPGTSGTNVSTINLAGGTLDLTGDNLGASGALITNLNFQSGTLANVNQINNGAGLTKSTTGTLNLTGVQNFTGNLAVNEGTLNLKATTIVNLSAGGNSVTVADGATLGATAFSPANSILSANGSLTLGTATGTTLNFSLAGNPTTPLLSFGGSVTTAGTTTINLATTSALTSGIITLINYGTTLGGAGFSAFTLGATPLRTNGILLNNAANTSVDIDLTADAIRWDGGTDNIWDINSTPNWKLITAGNPTTYLQPTAVGEPVTFDDLASGNFNITIPSAVNPVSITFNNSLNAYSLGGSGDLTSPNLIKNGSGSTTLSSNGIIAFSTIALNGGTLIFNRGADLTIDSTITGTATLQKDGANALTLSGNNSGFAGSVNVTTGTLKLGSNTALGTSAVNLSAGAILDLNSQTLTVGTGGVTLAGSGSVSSGTESTILLTNGGAVSTNPITGSTIVTVNAAGGTVSMSNANNTYTGNTKLSAGTLVLSGGNNRLPTGTTLAFNPANVVTTATLDMGANSQTLSALIYPGGNPSTAANSMALTITGTGTLAINGSSDLTFGDGGAGALDHATNQLRSLDMSGLSNFVFNGSNQNVLFGLSAASATKQTHVANIEFATNNTITASILGFGHNGGGSGGGRTTVELGQTNVWNIGTALDGDVRIGISRSDVDLRFATGLVNPSLTIRGSDGTSPMRLFTFGTVSDTSNRVWDDTVDLTAGSIDANITTMIVGLTGPSTTSREGTLTVRFNMGAGTMTIGDLTVGAFRATAPGNGTDGTLRATGIFTMTHPGGTLNASSITFGDVPTIVGGIGTVRGASGTLNLLDGIVASNLITRGSIVGANVPGGQGVGGVDVTARVDFSGGTIQNLSSNLEINDVEIRLLSLAGGSFVRTFNASTGNNISLNSGTVISGAGSFQKAGPGTMIVNGLNTHTGGVTVIAGLLQMGPGSLLSDGTAPLTVNGGTFDLNGTSQLTGLLNGLVTGTIHNSAASTTSILSVGNGNATGAAFFGTLSDAGGVLGLTKAGTGLFSLAGSSTYTGMTVVENGTLQVNVAPTSTSGITVNLNSTLVLNAGTAVHLTGLSQLNLATGGTGTSANLGFRLGDPIAPLMSDRLGTIGTASVANIVKFNLTGVSGFGPGNYTLLTATGGGLLTGGATYTVGNAPSGFGYIFTSSTDNSIILTVFAVPPTPGPVYWAGGGSTAWNTTVLGNSTNFTTDAAGTTTMNGLPGTGNTVIFNSTAVTVGNPTLTTLEANFNIGDLRFNANGASSVEIASGSGTNTLTLTPAVATSGILLETGAPSFIAITAPVALGAIQTWTITDGGATLAISGGLTGSFPLTKAGDGTLALSNVGAGFTGNLPTTGGTIAFSGDTVATILSGNITGTVILSKSGTQALTLSGTNTYTGGTQLLAGALKLHSASAIGSGILTITGGSLGNSSGSAVTLSTNNLQSWNSSFGFEGPNDLNLGNGTVTLGTTVQVTTSSGNLTVGGAITGPGAGLTKDGPGTLTLTGASTYDSFTTFNGGTIALAGGNNRLPTTTVLAFNTVNTSGLDATFDVGNTQQTITDLTFPVGSGFPGVAMTLNITGSGTLSIVNSTAALLIGAGGAAALTGAPTHTLNMSGLSNFIYNNPTQMIDFRLSVGSPANAAATVPVVSVNLAINNTITAKVFRLGAGGGSSGGGLNTLNLGQINNFNVGIDPTDGISVGMSSRSENIMKFATGLINPSATFRGNAGGSSPLPLFQIGRVNDTSTRTWNATVDLSAGTVDAIITDMDVGTAETSTTTRAGTQNSFFIMGAGSVFVSNNLRLGIFNVTAVDAGTESTMRGNGTFSLRSPAGTLTASTITLTDVPALVATANTKSATGTLELLDGLVQATTITRGRIVGAAVTGGQGAGGVTVTPRIDFSGGTIRNNDGVDLTIADVNIRLLTTTGGSLVRTFHATGSNSIILNSGTGISDAGGFVKTGPGTLAVAGANSYTGTTTVNEGTLALSGNNVAAIGDVNINGGASFGGTIRGTGTVGGHVTVGGGAVGGTIHGGDTVGALNLINGMTIQSGGRLAVEIAGIALPGGANTGDSTLGGLNPTTNNFINIAGGVTSINAGTIVVIDGTNAVFAPNESYSYSIAAGAGDQAALNIINPSQFSFINVQADPSSVSLTGSGGGSVYLNFSVIPEPAVMLLLAGIPLLRRRWKKPIPLD